VSSLKPHFTQVPFRQKPHALAHDSLFGAFWHTPPTQRLQAGPQSPSLLHAATQLPFRQVRPLLPQLRPSQLLSAQSLLPSQSSSVLLLQLVSWPWLGQQPRSETEHPLQLVPLQLRVPRSPQLFMQLLLPQQVLPTEHAP
jgi:hypothetical protein